MQHNLYILYVVYKLQDKGRNTWTALSPPLCHCNGPRLFGPLVPMTESLHATVNDNTLDSSVLLTLWQNLTGLRPKPSGWAVTPTAGQIYLPASVLSLTHVPEAEWEQIPAARRADTFTAAH